MFTLGQLICLQIGMLLKKGNFYQPLLINLIPSKQTRSVELTSLEKKMIIKFSGPCFSSFVPFAHVVFVKQIVNTILHVFLISYQSYRNNKANWVKITKLCSGLSL